MLLYDLHCFRCVKRLYTRIMPGKRANGDVKTFRARRGSSISQAMAETIEKMDESFHKTENVFLFLPNLIGYARIALAFASLQYMPMCVPIHRRRL